MGVFSVHTIKIVHATEYSFYFKSPCTYKSRLQVVGGRLGFVTLFDALSNAAYRLSLRGPEAELEGVSTTPHQVVENLKAHQGAV